jgi:hypothetical protein
MFAPARLGIGGRREVKNLLAQVSRAGDVATTAFLTLAHCGIMNRRIALVCVASCEKS